jgi:hypothetical protein
MLRGSSADIDYLEVKVTKASDIAVEEVLKNILLSRVS